MGWAGPEGGASPPRPGESALVRVCVLAAGEGRAAEAGPAPSPAYQLRGVGAPGRRGTSEPCVCETSAQGHLGPIGSKGQRGKGGWVRPTVAAGGLRLEPLRSASWPQTNADRNIPPRRPALYKATGRSLSGEHRLSQMCLTADCILLSAPGPRPGTLPRFHRGLSH